MAKRKLEIVPSEPGLRISGEELTEIKEALNSAREEFKENPYLQEARKVLVVKGYRSAIGSYWNAVVDDLRNKILHRSIDLFNREMQASLKREIKTYEDFQDHVTDYDLVEGAYKIGVIDWEARKILHHARETRNIFDGHPKSTEPTVIKVIDMIIDCNKYVLAIDYPTPVVNIDNYIAAMDTADYMRDELAVEQTLGDLPEVYKVELINRFFDIYKHDATSTTLRGNIEFCAPILWRFLPKETKHQVGKRVDRELQSGQTPQFERAVDFLTFVDGGLRYTTTRTRQVVFAREIALLENNLDNWEVEGRVCANLQRLGMNIPENLIPKYVMALTHAYVGYQGRQAYFSWSAAPIIRKIFEGFDEYAADAFVRVVKESSTLHNRLGNRNQLERLRTLGNILLERTSLKSNTHKFLELLANEEKEREFYRLVRLG